MARRLACLLVVLALVTTMVVGCTSKNPEPVNNSTSSQSSQASTVDTRQPIDVTIGMDSDLAVSDDELGKTLQDKVKINFKVVNVKDKLAVMKSADELPDIVHLTIGDPTYYSFVDNKLIRTIPATTVANYPGVKKLIEDNPFVSAHGKKDNNYIGIPCPANAAQPLKGTNQVLTIRWDWAQNVGVTKIPETTDELYTMLQKITTGDPDKNDVVADTCGYTGPISAANYAPWVDIHSWVKEGDSWIPAYLSQAMIPALKYWNKLSVEKIIPDGTIANAAIDDFTNDYSGCYLTNATSYDMWNDYLSKWATAKKDYLAELVKSNKTAADCLKQLPVLKVDANTPAKASFDYDKTISAISAKVDDNKLQRILEFYEYSLSPEGKDFAHYGMVDKTYVISDGTAYTMLPPSDTTYGSQKTLPEVYPSVAVFQMVAGDTGYNTKPSQTAYPQWITDAQQNAYNSITSAVTLPNVMISTLETPVKKANTSISNWTQIESDLAAIVTGTNVDADFAAFKTKYLGANQCQAAIDEVNAKVKSDNLEAAQ